MKNENDVLRLYLTGRENHLSHSEAIELCEHYFDVSKQDMSFIILVYQHACIINNSESSDKIVNNAGMQKIK